MHVYHVSSLGLQTSEGIISYGMVVGHHMGIGHKPWFSAEMSMLLTTGPSPIPWVLNYAFGVIFIGLISPLAEVFFMTSKPLAVKMPIFLRNLYKLYINYI